MKRSAAFWLVLAASADASAQDLSRRVSLDCDRAPIDVVVDGFRAATGVDIRIDASVRERLRADDVRVTFRGRDLTLRTALCAVLAAKRLAAVRRGDVLTVVPRSSLLVTEIYDVRDLVHGVRDFVPLGDFGFPRAQDAPPPVFTLDDTVRGDAAEPLVDVVRTLTGGRSWEGGDSAMHLVNGLLIVTQTRPVHREIRDLLRRLRH